MVHLSKLDLSWKIVVLPCVQYALTVVVGRGNGGGVRAEPMQSWLASLRFASLKSSVRTWRKKALWPSFENVLLVPCS